MSDLDNRNAREIGVNTGRIAPQQYAAEGGVGLLKGMPGILWNRKSVERVRLHPVIKHSCSLIPAGPALFEDRFCGHKSL